MCKWYAKRCEKRGKIIADFPRVRKIHGMHLFLIWETSKAGILPRERRDRVNFLGTGSANYCAPMIRRGGLGRELKGGVVRGTHINDGHCTEMKPIADSASSLPLYLATQSISQRSCPPLRISKFELERMAGFWRGFPGGFRRLFIMNESGFTHVTTMMRLMAVSSPFIKQPRERN